MVEVTSEQIAQFFQDGQITYAEAVALVVQARRYVANHPQVFRDFTTYYAAVAGKPWPGQASAFVATGEAHAIRFALAKHLESVGFDPSTAKDQGEAIAGLWLDHASADATAQREAHYDTGGLVVRYRLATPKPPAPAGSPTRFVADAAVVTLAGSVQGQQLIKSTFEGGITGPKTRKIVYGARLHAGQPTASSTQQIQDVVTGYLSDHGFPAATARQLGEMIEAAWREHDRTGTATFVDVSTITLGSVRGGGVSGAASARLTAQAATVPLQGSAHGQALIRRIFGAGRVSGNDARLLVYWARRHARVPDSTADAEKLRGALRVYFEDHGFPAEAAANLAELVERAWREHDRTGRDTQVDVTAVQFVKPGAEPRPVASVTDIQARYQTLDARLARLRGRCGLAGMTPIGEAQARSTALQAEIVAKAGSLSFAELAAQHDTTEKAAEILDRFERVIAALGAYRLSLSDAPYPNRAGYLSAVDEVEGAYFAAVASMFDKTAGGNLFNAAETKAAELPYVLTEVDLTAFESRKPSSVALEDSRKSIARWAQWARGEVQALKEAVKSQAANVDARSELIQLSLEGMGHWETALRAFETLAKGGSFFLSAYRDIAFIVDRCRLMQEAAVARNRKLLRERVQRHAADPDVARLYRGLPLLIFGSRFAVGLGVTFVAAVLTAGIGGFVSNALGSGLLATAGTVVVEALVFTAVSRGLQSLVPGATPKDSFLVELAWNFGLFGALRFVGAATKSLMAARGLPALTKVATPITSFPLLQGYGALRYRLAEGHWPTAEERAKMTAENVLMLAALTIGLRISDGLAGRGELPQLSAFYRKYGWRLRAVASLRQTLEERVGDLGRAGERIVPEEARKIQEQAKVVDDELKRLMDEVQADASVNVPKLREELADAEHLAGDGAGEILENELRIAAEEKVDLRRAGGVMQFSFRSGVTTVIEKALRALGAHVIKRLDPATNLATLEARFGDGPTYFFTERAEGFTERPLDVADPTFQRLLADFSIQDPSARRAVQIGVERQHDKNQSAGTKGAIGKIRADLKQLADRVKRQGATGERVTVEGLLRDLGFEGARLWGTPKEPLTRVAEQMKAAGATRTKGWLRARGDEARIGALGEWVAHEQALQTLAGPGERVVQGVRFRGDAFQDPQATQPVLRSNGQKLAGTDVGPELDFLVVAELPGGKLEYRGIMNVKVTQTAAKSAAEATQQNVDALAALDAHASGQLASIKGRFARITTVKGTDPSTGADVDLTGRLQRGPSVRQEIMGPKGDKGYTQKLEYGHGEIEALARLLADLTTPEQTRP